MLFSSWLKIPKIPGSSLAGVKNLEAFERSLRDKAKVEIYDETFFAGTASKDLAPEAPASGDAAPAATEEVSGDKTSQ